MLTAILGKILVKCLAAILTSLLAYALTKLAPPPKATRDDYEALRERFGALEGISQVACFIGMFAAIALGLKTGKNTFWLLGLLFGGMVTIPVALIAGATLGKSREEWDSFWRFYAIKYKVGVRLLYPLYASLCVLGFLSLFMLLA